MRSQIVTILTLLLSFLSTTVMAQGRDATPPAPTAGRGPTFPEAPIDDGILILIIVGLLYGGYIAYKKYVTSQKEA